MIKPYNTALIQKLQQSFDLIADLLAAASGSSSSIIA